MTDGIMETQFPQLTLRDVGQLTLPLLDKDKLKAPLPEGSKVLYHGSCHCEWADVHKIKGQKQIIKALGDFSGAKIALNPGCCGESGMRFTPAVVVPEVLCVFFLTGSHFRFLANAQPRRKPLPKQRPVHGAGRYGGYFSRSVQSVMACMRAVA